MTLIWLEAGCKALFVKFDLLNNHIDCYFVLFVRSLVFGNYFYSFCVNYLT